MQDHLDRMCATVLRHTRGVVRQTAIPRIGVGAAQQPGEPSRGVYRPMVCLILQGAKQVIIGDQVLRYDPASCFIASLELPATGRVIEATPQKPYVAVSLTLDPDALADLLPNLPPLRETAQAGFGVTPVTPELLSAWDQLLALLDAPGDIAALAPLREREVLYRLLTGPQGPMLRQIARRDAPLARVRRAIDHIQTHYDAPVRVEQLAEIAGMSVPSFHRHFKAATAMSPLQFHKTMRLQAARRLLSVDANASSAAFAVGYESASQFSREYARLFGSPPGRDAQRLRDGGGIERAVV